MMMKTNEDAQIALNDIGLETDDIPTLRLTNIAFEDRSGCSCIHLDS